MKSTLIWIVVSYLPIRMAPATSQNVANQHAWRIVNTPEPTLVPNEFATSFAPIPNARMNAIIKPMITSHKTASEYGSIAMNFFMCYFLRVVAFLVFSKDTFKDVFFFNILVIYAFCISCYFLCGTACLLLRLLLWIFFCFNFQLVLLSNFLFFLA